MRSQEPGPELGRGLRPAAGRGGGRGRREGARRRPCSLQPSCPTLSHHPRPPLRPSVHLRGGDNPRRPPPRPVRNKDGSGDTVTGGPRPAVAQPPPPASRTSRPVPAARAHSPRPSGPRRRKGRRGLWPGIHRAIVSAAPAAPARPLRRERGHVVGGEGWAEPRVLGAG